jgi:5-methylcytosine-specific restriction endonuclease McrA
MGFSDDDLLRIFDRTNGKCHICYKKLSFSNYGRLDAKGAWEVEHSVPQSKGGTDHLNNLYAACIVCNRSKGNRSTKSARSWFNNTTAPPSREKVQREKRQKRILNWVLGLAVIGGLIALFHKKSKSADKTRGSAI